MYYFNIGWPYPFYNKILAINNCLEYFYKSYFEENFNLSCEDLENFISLTIF